MRINLLCTDATEVSERERRWEGGDRLWSCPLTHTLSLSVSSMKALGRQELLRHLLLFGLRLAQSKPSGLAQGCTGQAPAEMDGATVRVYPPPKDGWPNTDSIINNA